MADKAAKGALLVRTSSFAALNFNCKVLYDNSFSGFIFAGLVQNDTIIDQSYLSFVLALTYDCAFQLN